MAVVFERRAELGAVNLALLAQTWRDDFPVVREVPGTPPPLLDPRSQKIEVGVGPLPTRLWLLSDSGVNLIQVQNDTFIYNWRLTNEADAYPGHKRILDDFSRLWTDFNSKMSGTEPLHPRLVEWTYVDKLDLAHPSNELLHFVDDSLNKLPGRSLSLSFQVIREIYEGDLTTGFLSVQGAPARMQSGGEEFFALNITTKLDASGRTSVDTLALLRKAHDTSFNAFTSVVPDYRPPKESVV